jgi:hypothetical protein
MLTEEQILLSELQNLPEVEYPDEVVDRWEKQAEIAILQIATGELVSKTAAELAAEWGIEID